MANLGRLFDPSPHHSKENGEIFVFSFLQPTKSRKISYREQQELLRISLEEHPDFNKEGIILDTIEKGGELTGYWDKWQQDKCQTNIFKFSLWQLPTFFICHLDHLPLANCQHFNFHEMLWFGGKCPFSDVDNCLVSNCPTFSLLCKVLKCAISNNCRNGPFCSKFALNEAKMVPIRGSYLRCYLGRYTLILTKI